MAFHIEVDAKEEERIKELIQFAKHEGIFKTYFGKRVHISGMLTKASTNIECKRMIEVTLAHANYQIPMTADYLMGIKKLKAGVRLSPE